MARSPHRFTTSSTIGSPQSRPSPTHSPNFTRESDLSLFKTQSTSIRSTTTISRMPLISRLRLHRTLLIALPVQWISLKHRYPYTVLHHQLHPPSPHLIVDAGPAHATYTVPTSAPREPVMSASREPPTYPPKEPPMPPTRQPEVVQQREIPATSVPTPPPNRESPPNKAPPPSQHRRSSRASAAFTPVRTHSALRISLTLVPASLAGTTPATFRISSPTQPSLRSSSQLTVHSPRK
jgi:hypothetical protein